MLWRREPWCSPRWVSWGLQKTWPPRLLVLPPGWLSPRQHQTVVRQEEHTHVGKKPHFLTVYVFDEAVDVLEPDWWSCYLVCQAEQHAEEPSQVSLSSWKLSSTWVICSVQSCGTVHYQQSIPDTHNEGLEQNYRERNLQWPHSWRHRLTWTRPSWQRPGTAAGSDGLCWKLERTPRCPERHYPPDRTWEHGEVTWLSQQIKNDFWCIWTWKSQHWVTPLYPTAFFFKTYRSATARSLSGLKVPSVSMYMALPSPPPWSMGSWGQKRRL